MNYLELKFKNVKVFLPANATESAVTQTQIRPSSAGAKIARLKTSLEELVFAVAGSVHEKLKRLPVSESPSEIELSFSVGFSAELDAWVIGGKAEQSIELKLVWSKTEKDKQ